MTATLTGGKRKADIVNELDVTDHVKRRAEFGNPATNFDLNCVEIEGSIRSSILKIEEKNRIIKRLIELEKGGKLEKIDTNCEELIREHEKKNLPPIETLKNKLRQEYDDKIMSYLHHELNLPLICSKTNTLYKIDRKTRGDLLFYLIISIEQPEQNFQTRIVRRLLNYSPILDQSWTWFAMCCAKLKHDSTFTQFYKQFGNNPAAIKYLLAKRPQLLLNAWSSDLMHRLIEHLSYEDLHQILTSTRDEKGRTCMFYSLVLDTTSCYSKLYADHVYDLYELLFKQDINGQTALHVNITGITPILADTHSPKLRQEFSKLLSITDKNGQTAMQLNELISAPLRGLTAQVLNNQYVLRNEPTVLIIYRVNGRPGAEAEASCIFEAFKSTHLYNVTMKQMTTKDRLLKLVRNTVQQSAVSDKHALPPSALIVIILTHGSIGMIYDSKGQSIKLSEIEEVMCENGRLKEKPKMLLMQCCQIETSSESTSPYVPTHDHFCAVMSCVAGQPSERGIFISKLSESIKISRNDGNVSRMVNRIGKQMELEGHPQTPIIMSTLRSEFCPAHSQWWA